MSTHAILLAEVEAFLDQFGMPPTKFGLEAANDAKLVSDLREGRDLRASMIDRIRTYMRDFVPPEHPKPRAAYQPAV